MRRRADQRADQRGLGAAAGALALLLAGCDAGPPAAPPVTVTPIAGETAPLYIAGLTFAIPRGTAVGAYTFALGRCWPYDDRLYWGVGALSPYSRAGNWTAAIAGVLGDAGLRLPAIRNDPFAAAGPSRTAPALVLAGEVTGARFEVCDRVGWWSGERLDRQSGRATVEVSWRLYALGTERMVARLSTSGRGRVAAGRPFGVTTLLRRAVAEAAAALAAAPAFRRSVVADSPAQGDAGLSIPRQPLLTGRLRDHPETALGAVARLDAGAGRGAGVFVAPEVLLTGARAVAGRREMTLRLADGRRVTGRVLRRAGGVALLRVPAGNPKVLPIRTRPASPREPVHALRGLEPGRAGRSFSFGRGVAGARRTGRDSLPMLPVALDGSGGRGGGPLLDAAGNVIGIAHTIAGPTAGPALFLPIAEALDGLNLTLRGPGPVQNAGVRAGTTTARLLP